ncbi:MAG: GMC family oxidoreductase [Gammaproteobacteria bacterium]|nr:MAG: GMC family oxidoreductase [Gammaproteobacteria bacterium]
MDNTFDVIVVGTSFSGSFFLHGYLPKANKNARILVLEQGQMKSQRRQQLQQHNKPRLISSQVPFFNHTPEKPWIVVSGFGGGSRAWWACTPRMMPNDFKLKSVYDVGVDWPLTYQELEPYYTRSEIIMAVSGADDGAPYPRSRPYPQPPHRFSDPDRLLTAAYPDQYFQQATARARVSTANRPLCCGTGVCNQCPIDSKFTILNEMAHLYRDPRVTLLFEAEALAVETAAGQATGVRYLKDGIEQNAKANLVVLGANAIFNPYLLQRSNLEHPLLGKGLNEQVGVYVNIDLDGVDNFQGSTSITGHGYMLYDGVHRSKYAACIIEVWNVPNRLRVERGRWRQRCRMKFIFEDLPDKKNEVKVSTTLSHQPEVVYKGYSAYTQRGIDSLPNVLPKMLAPLPVEKLTIEGVTTTEGHILGTTVMGDDPTTSIVDKYLIHHQVRNLMVLGSSVFPTSAPANPTLTLSALTLWAVDHL